MLSLVKGRIDAVSDARFEPGTRRTHRRVSSPEPRPRVSPVTRIPVAEAEPRGARVARHVLRMAVVAGSLTAAWQIGMIVGQL